MRSLLFIVTAFAAALCSGQDHTGKPNILFIAIDDLNDWIEPLNGHPDTLTPNLRRLAAMGTTFSNAHCAAPSCNPSRTSLMTGVHPTNSGVYANTDIWRESPVLADIKTIPEYFRDHGYSIQGAGKIYHTLFPDPRSWDTFYPALDVQRPIEAMPPKNAMPLHGIKGLEHFDWGELDVTKEEMADWKVVDWVAQKLSQPTDQPLFLACGIYRPHLPWYLPKGYIDSIDLDSVDLPPIKFKDLADVPVTAINKARVKDDDTIVVQADKQREAVRAYLASIRFADECLGHVLDALESGPHKSNTVIVLWSDHGWQLGEKRHWRKFTLWERATRSPLLFAGPGVPSGQNAIASVNLIDIYPTLVELACLPANTLNDGQSLTPFLANPDTHAPRPTLTSLSQTAHSLRDERFRYTRYSDGSEELYDHSVDRHEWTNLADNPAYAGHKARLAAHLPLNPVPRIETQHENISFFDRQKRLEDKLRK
ncbi:sulfatase [Pelagicoccus mobilis]|uniref:Sulfatase n=1 Tax=Pelagicoccus mobilis TaxID=415221 RepID=A0A934VQU5_9BACT|nr:sulfatase [Pelagicoccus mobilis]MBK1878707.1 sulfatase [Pelagicoccus mobilis]